MPIVICSLSAIDAVARSTRASHMLTVISAGTEVRRPASIAAEDHLYLAFNDITAPADGLVPPGPEHIEQLLGFARGWDRSRPLLVHCWAGVSRSTAAGYIIAHALTENSDPQILARLLRARAPWATPNARMIALADKTLGENGRMRDAIAGIGRGAMAYEGKPFELPVGDEAH